MELVTPSEETQADTSTLATPFYAEGNFAIPIEANVPTIKVSCSLLWYNKSDKNETGGAIKRK